MARKFEPTHTTSDGTPVIVEGDFYGVYVSTITPSGHGLQTFGAAGSVESAERQFNLTPITGQAS